MVGQKQTDFVREVELSAQGAELCAGGIRERAILGLAGHSGQIELDCEVEADIGWNLGDFVADRQDWLTGGECDCLSEPDCVLAGPAGAFHDQRDFARVALNLGLERAEGEVAAVDVAAGDEVIEFCLDREEVIDERLAWMRVDDRLPGLGWMVEVWREWVVGSAVKRRECVGELRAEVELVNMAAAGGAGESDEVVILEADLLARIEVEIADVDACAGRCFLRSRRGRCGRRSSEHRRHF